ncbi:aldehyde dehydrogenase family protein [Orrella marina]|uniref:Aldehyde dehydrogenase domain-containing protein n=1 Tax=Orrella marina TaxID=2163011 RepID=A0A2R4XIG3_9BURK|nr:aldehyde dehydrogenase family protein [Orrella marina]AWB33590.1 hypothetical protein DBV39_07570 [Orrella marina]
MTIPEAVPNPSTEEVLAQVPDMEADDMATAIKAAHKALGPWKGLTPRDRSILPKRWHQEAQGHSESLATQLTLEQDKSFAKVHAEVLSPPCPRKANSTPYDRSAYLYTRSADLIFRVTKALEYGMVGVNTPRFVSGTVPFCGVKESRIGREGSQYGIEEFLEIHHVCVAEFLHIH